MILKIKVSSNLVLTIKSCEPEKIYLVLENRGRHLLKVIDIQQKSHHRIQHIREPYCGSFRAPIFKNVEFRNFCQKTTNHGLPESRVRV